MEKNTNVPGLRFPEFEGEWVEKKLGEITTYVDYRGKTPEKSDYGIFLVTAKNIKQGYIDYDISKEYIPNESYEEVMRRGKPQLGDILITTEAPLGNIASVDKEGIALAQRVIKLRGEKDVLQNLFLKHRLMSPQFQDEIDAKGSGTTAKGIKGSELHKIIISFPTFCEQTKIASFLTAVDDKLTQLKKKKSLLEEYKKGVMQKIFSQELRFKDDNGEDFPEWEEKKFGDIGFFFSGGTPLTTKKEYFNGEIPFIRSGEINSDKTEQFITELGLQNSSAKMIEVGDLIYALYGATSGGVAISKIKGAINQAILCIRTNEVNSFLYYFLLLKKQVIVNTYIQGGQGNLSADIIKALYVPIPSLPEQTKIANFLSTIDEKINHCSKQIERMEDWKKGLLQQMFC